MSDVRGCPAIRFWSRIDKDAVRYRIYRILYYYPDLTAYGLTRELLYMHDMELTENDIRYLIDDEVWVIRTVNKPFNVLYRVDESAHTPFKYMMKDAGRLKGGPDSINTSQSTDPACLDGRVPDPDPEEQKRKKEKGGK